MQKTPRRAKTGVEKDHLGIGMQIRPRTEAQRQMIEAYVQNMNVVAFGSAGSGKSFLACFLALGDLFKSEKEKIVIVRSAVQTRDMGFLPGDLAEKTAAYTIPYKQIVNELCMNGTAWDILTKKGRIEFMTTSYIRGITLDNCTLIIDEFQNMTQEELYSVLTRVGENCQVIVCGDTRQCDLNKNKKEVSAFGWMMEITQKMNRWFEAVEFLPQDIVRSDFVKALIMANEGD